MSKTLGNVVDPIDTIEEYGTDALRFTLALGTAGQVVILAAVLRLLRRNRKCLSFPPLSISGVSSSLATFMALHYSYLEMNVDINTTAGMCVTVFQFFSN